MYKPERFGTDLFAESACLHCIWKDWNIDFKSNLSKKKKKTTLRCTKRACRINTHIPLYSVHSGCSAGPHTHSEEFTSTHQCTHFSAMEYLLVPDSLSLTRKLASLQRCSWASACCRLTLPWYQLGRGGRRGRTGKWWERQQISDIERWDIRRRVKCQASDRWWWGRERGRERESKRRKAQTDTSEELREDTVTHK